MSISTLTRETELERRRAAAVVAGIAAEETPLGVVQSWSKYAPLYVSALLRSRERVAAAVETHLTDRLEQVIGLDVAPVVIDPAELSTATKTRPYDVTDLVARTPYIVQNRVAQGQPLAEAASASLSYVNAVVVSEAFRVQRVAMDDAVTTDARFKGWRRIAEPNACRFCRMLATRGAVYYSQSTANSGPSGLRYHSHCRCRVEEVVDVDLAKQIKEQGQTAWLAQVSEGRAPIMPIGAGRTLSARNGSVRVPPEFSSPESYLRSIEGQLKLEREIAGERTRTKGRKEYALARAERLTKIRDRLLAVM